MVSASDISDALEGLSYPATKQDILVCAWENETSEDVMDELKELDSEYYNSIDEVYNQFGVQPEIPVSEVHCDT